MRRVLNYLSSGKSLTASQAQTRYGVKNFRALISEVKHIVETNGNWEVVTDTNNKGETVYSMNDTHPGIRTYGFKQDGSRFVLA